MSRPRSRRPLFVVAGALALALAVAGPVAAKEITSGGGGGGGGGGSTTCQPVTSLKARADARVGELGFANLDADYSVKSCTGAPVTVRVLVAEANNPAVVVYDDPNAPASGKVTVNGIRVRVTYRITVTVTDAASGTVQGSLSTSTAAIPKGV